MITNDRQYKIVKSQIEQFQQSLDELLKNTEGASNVHPKIFEASRNAIISQLRQLNEMVTEYESLKSGEVLVTPINSLTELPLALIKARIVNGLTQAELAEKLGLKMQQIQRYESERYETASLKTLEKIASQLGIVLHGDVQLAATNNKESLDVSKYPFKEMFKRKWFTDFTGDLNAALKNSATLLHWLFDQANLDSLQLNLNRQTLRTNKEIDSFALKAWYARVLIKAVHQNDIPPFNQESMTEDWFSGLVKLSSFVDGLQRVTDYVNEVGIRLIIEEQLPGTKLDGAALLVANQSPVVALTLRYDRLDNFWFVLFHELAHVRLHLSQHAPVIFDDLDTDAKGIEEEADKFALNLLIPNDVWRKSLVRFSPSEETVQNQAAELGISPALVAGRIRRETGKYHLLTNLVGSGEVRKAFENDYYH
ncbi:XRE family transcriptional regulator [Mucilaginibacter jinjuensis]|uniref:XRE family transcriptional regulator n=1 Tax=Mucilaginibacter jinjuensis TaxID=1176721 RepID=A0ABY7T5E8_9SPHI|nr:XRE family transcriptional regulator [Mucilaginibacter jinjuensis]WCT11561.1 XRE family transcriptional regulator [Mucilaginibacter jinjuensis]